MDHITVFINTVQDIVGKIKTGTVVCDFSVGIVECGLFDVRSLF